MKLLTIAFILVALFAAPALADHKNCGRTNRRPLRTDHVAMATQIGDVAIWPGGTIDWVEILDSACNFLRTEIEYIQLTNGGAVCGVPIDRGVSVSGVTVTAPPRRQLQLLANNGSTVTVNGLTLRADLATLVCSAAGVSVSSGVLAKPGSVAGVALNAGDWFSANGCVNSLSLLHPAQVNGHTFPAFTRIGFEGCRPTSVQTLDGAPPVTKVSHGGVTCILDHRSRDLSFHPATGNFRFCQNVEPFTAVIAGATRAVTGGFSGVHFFPDGRIQEADLADDIFFGVLLRGPHVEVAPDGRLLRVRGSPREPHVFGTIACRASYTILDGSGAVEACDREH